MLIESTALVFQVSRLQQASPEDDIEIPVVVEVGENRAHRVAWQVEAARGRVLGEGAVAIVVEQHVLSDSDGDIDVVKPISIDVRHRDAVFLVRGDRRKIRMRQ